MSKLKELSNFPRWMKDLKAGDKVIVELCKQKKVHPKFFSTLLFPDTKRLYGLEQSPYERKFRGWIIAVDPDQILVQIRLHYPNEHMEIPVLIYSSERKHQLLEGGKLVRGVYSLPSGIFWTMTLKNNKGLILQRKLAEKKEEVTRLKIN